MNLPLKIAGIILVVIGLILTYKPNLITGSPTTDSYQMIEKRVKWGFAIGLGVFLIFHRDWSSWQLTITALLSALTLGIIIARLLGFVLDGFFTKQLLWLFIELAALLLFGFLYWKMK